MSYSFRIPEEDRSASAGTMRLMIGWTRRIAHSTAAWSRITPGIRWSRNPREEVRQNFLVAG